MSLAKFSAKKMGIKLKQQKKLAALKKAEEEQRRKQENIRLEELAKERERERLRLEEVQRNLEKQWHLDQKKFMIKCLNAAMSGEKSIRTDEFSSHLKTKGFAISKKVVKYDPIILLDKNLKKLKAKELDELKIKLAKIFEPLMRLKIDFINTKIDRIIQEKSNFLFCEKGFLFLSKYLNIENDIYFDFEGEDYGLESRALLEEQLNKHYDFIRKFMPLSIDDVDKDPETQTTYTLHWDKEREDLIGDNWFNGKNLNWIASKAGRIFFDQFLALVNSKTEALSSYLLFDVVEKSKYTYLVFDDESKVKTPIPINQLLEIFELFGYKKRLPRAAKDGNWKGVKISWA
jgi:hypothetical protein